MISRKWSTCSGLEPHNILTQWCITGLNFTLHFKYIIILCCQNRYVFIVDTPTRDRSVHENYQHVKGWNLNHQFSNIAKIKFLDKNISLCMLIKGFFKYLYLHKDVRLFIPKFVRSPEK